MNKIYVLVGRRKMPPLQIFNIYFVVNLNMDHDMSNKIKA